MPQNTRLRNRLATLLACLPFVACGGTARRDMTAERLPSLRDVTPAQWQALASRRIFFGHQSVGKNIMAGVAELLNENPQIHLRVVETADPDSMREAGFYHARIGQNGDPALKTQQFVRAAEQLGGGVALLKYCYVDVDRRTDPARLFEQYRRAIDTLRARHPDLTIVHVTMPLTDAENWKGLLVAKLRGRTTARSLNAIRNRYNTLLRAAYPRDPIFDVARIESTHADGTRNFFTSGRDTVYYLAPELTSDGDHPNEAASRTAAEQLLVLLARL